MKKLSGSLALAGVILLTLSRGAAPVSAQTGRNGQLHVTKDCSKNTGLPGEYCTIQSSSLVEIVPGAKIYYDQAMGVPAGLLDSNVVLDAGNGNRALGRCTVDLTTLTGLCTFSDGTGQFAGFSARVNVSYVGGANGYLWAWEGTYRFSALPPR